MTFYTLLWRLAGRRIARVMTHIFVVPSGLFRNLLALKTYSWWFCNVPSSLRSTLQGSRSILALAFLGLFTFRPCTYFCDYYIKLKIQMSIVLLMAPVLFASKRVARYKLVKLTTWQSIKAIFSLFLLIYRRRSQDILRQKSIIPLYICTGNIYLQFILVKKKCKNKLTRLFIYRP